MLQAADSLAATEFDLAYSQQSEAMRALVEAKEDLTELALGNLSAAQRAAFARLLRDLRQMLGLARVDTDRELANSLRLIAEDQLALAVRVEQTRQAMIADPAAEENAASDAVPEEQASDAADQTEDAENESVEKVSAADDAGDTVEEAAESTEDENDGEDSAEDDPRQQLSVALDDQLAIQLRLQDVGDTLSEQVLESELVASRLSSSLEAMNDMADLIRQEELAPFPEASQIEADRLRELAVLIESLSEREPVDRVSALSQLSATLADMETDMSRAIQFDEETSEEDAAPQARLMAMARRVGARVATTREAFSRPTAADNDEASAVAAQLAEFMQESEILDTLTATESTANELADGDMQDAAQDLINQMSERAGDYSDAAERLSSLYRELLAPRIARLRELEQDASELEEQMRGMSEEDMRSELTADLVQLAQELRAAGLEEIAALLESGRLPASSGDASGGELDSSERVALAVRLLREQIQQMVLIEIAQDRDAPVPPQFREMVDRYFQVLSGATLDDSEEDTL